MDVQGHDTARPTEPAPQMGRAFLTVWAGQTVSLIGTTATGVGASLWAYLETGSVLWLSGLYLAGQLPGLLLASFAGGRVDGGSRKRILLTADAVAAIATLTAVALHLTIGLQPWHLVFVVMLGSAANAFQEPAYQASLPLLVPRPALGRANGLLQLAPAVSIVAGAPFAGLALGLGGIGTVLAVDLITFAIAVTATAVTPIPDPPRTDPSTADSAAMPRGSIRAVWRHLDGPRRGLRRLAVGFALVNLMLTLVNVLFLALLLTVTSEQTAGMVAGLSGAAMVIASLVVSARGVPERRVPTILLGIAGIGIGMIIAGLRPSVILIGAGLIVMLASVPASAAASNTLFMEKIAAGWQGRLQAFRRVASQILMPVAVIAVAPLVDHIAEPAMAEAGSLSATVGAVLGTGPGRGIALVFVAAGVGVLAIVTSMAADVRLRSAQTMVPDAEAPGTIESRGGRPVQPSVAPAVSA